MNMAYGIQIFLIECDLLAGFLYSGYELAGPMEGVEWRNSARTTKFIHIYIHIINTVWLKKTKINKNSFLSGPRVTYHDSINVAPPYPPPKKTARRIQKTPKTNKAARSDPPGPEHVAFSYDKRVYGKRQTPEPRMGAFSWWPVVGSIALVMLNESGCIFIPAYPND